MQSPEAVSMSEYIPHSPLVSQNLMRFDPPVLHKLSAAVLSSGSPMALVKLEVGWQVPALVVQSLFQPPVLVLVCYHHQC